MLTHYSLPPTFTLVPRGFDALNQSIAPTKFVIFEGHPLTLQQLDRTGTLDSHLGGYTSPQSELAL